MSDRDKDAEILVPRHQIAVLERQLGGTKVRFTAPDRAFLAALLHRLSPEVLRRIRLLVRPDTVLRWHRDLARLATLPGPGRSDLADRRRRVPSVPSCCGWSREPPLGLQTRAR